MKSIIFIIILVFKSYGSCEDFQNLEIMYINGFKDNIADSNDTVRNLNKIPTNTFDVINLKGNENICSSLLFNKDYNQEISEAETQVLMAQDELIANNNNIDIDPISIWETYTAIKFGSELFFVSTYGELLINAFKRIVPIWEKDYAKRYIKPNTLENIDEIRKEFRRSLDVRSVILVSHDQGGAIANIIAEDYKKNEEDLPFRNARFQKLASLQIAPFSQFNYVYEVTNDENRGSEITADIDEIYEEFIKNNTNNYSTNTQINIENGPNTELDIKDTNYHDINEIYLNDKIIWGSSNSKSTMLDRFLLELSPMGNEVTKNSCNFLNESSLTVNINLITDRSNGNFITINYSGDPLSTEQLEVLDTYIISYRPSDRDLYFEDFDEDTRLYTNSARIFRDSYGEVIKMESSYKAIEVSEALYNELLSIKNNSTTYSYEFDVISPFDYYRYGRNLSPECENINASLSDSVDLFTDVFSPIIVALNGSTITLEGNLDENYNINKEYFYEIRSVSTNSINFTSNTFNIEDIKLALENKYELNVSSGYDHKILFYEAVSSQSEILLFEKNISIPQIQQDVVTKRISMINDSPFRVTQLQYHKIEAELDSGEKVIEEGCSRVSSQQSLDIVPIFKQYVVEFQENNGQTLNASRITLNNFVYTGVKSLNETLGSINLQWYADGNLIQTGSLPQNYQLYYRFYPEGELNETILEPYVNTPPNVAIPECVL